MAEGMQINSTGFWLDPNRMRAYITQIKSLILAFSWTVAVTSLYADWDPFLHNRPAWIESIDREKQTAIFTVDCHDYKSPEKPVPGRIASISGVDVHRLQPNNRRLDATLDDVRPGMKVLISGVIPISGQTVTEIDIDERHPAKSP